MCSAGLSGGIWSGQDSPPGGLQSPSGAQFARQEKAWLMKIPDLPPDLLHRKNGKVRKTPKADSSTVESTALCTNVKMK